MAEPAPASSPVIELRSVRRRFGALTAVDDVSLALREGEFFALLGPSGCGKTTLLRLVAGFERPDAGEILLDGRDVTALRPGRRPINLMFQSYALFPHMSVRRNIAYGLEMERLPAAEIAARVDAVIGTTELGALAERKPDQLSGGQKQRVALARALVKRPRVLLLDEPLGALDRKLREQMQFELKRLQHELGITFVLVTHDQDEAVGMADRIALMRDGAVVQVASPETLYERPATRFVADFIGVSNFIDGRYADGRLVTRSHGALAVDADHDVADGREACLCIRPEHVEVVAADGPAVSRATVGRPVEGVSGTIVEGVSGTIVESVYRGQDVELRIAVADADVPLVARLPSARRDGTLHVAGRAVRCRWPLDRARLLSR